MIDLQIQSIGTLLTLADGPGGPRRAAQMAELGLLHNAVVGINSLSGRIEYAGKPDGLDSSQLSADVEVIDAQGRLVMPGFVDSHTHLVFAGDRVDEFYRRAAGESYADIARSGGGIRKTMQATRHADVADLRAGALSRYRRLLANGTTTVECKSGYGLSIESERLAMQVINGIAGEAPGLFLRTYMGAHLVPPEFADRRMEYAKQVADELTWMKEHAMCDFYDIFVDPLAFSHEEAEVIVSRGMELGLALKLHADEFGDDGTAAWAVSRGAVSADHLGGIGPGGIEALAHSNTVATLLPGTMFFSGHGEYAPARQMIDAGCAVALATDLNPGSSLMYSMPLVMTLAVLEMGMSAAECITAATINGAHALGVANETGSIEAGKRADLLLMDCDSPEAIAYHVGTNLVSTVVCGGKPVRT